MNTIEINGKKGMTFKWEWCNVCECMMVICPKCGNNCCNASWGPHTGKEDDGTCEVCNLAYEYQSLADKAGLVPQHISKETMGMMDSSIENFKKGIVSPPINLEDV